MGGGTANGMVQTWYTVCRTARRLAYNFDKGVNNIHAVTIDYIQRILVLTCVCRWLNYLHTCFRSKCRIN